MFQRSIIRQIFNGNLNAEYDIWKIASYPDQVAPYPLEVGHLIYRNWNTFWCAYSDQVSHHLRAM